VSQHKNFLLFDDGKEIKKQSFKVKQKQISVLENHNIIIALYFLNTAISYQVLDYILDKVLEQ